MDRQTEMESTTKRPASGPREQPTASESSAENTSEGNGTFQRSMKEAKRYAAENPKTSLLVPLALGVGTGLLLTLLSGKSASKKSRDEWSARRLLDSLSEQLPDVLGKRLHS